jgi:hypothetical protein
LVAGDAAVEDAARHAHWGNALVEEAQEREGHEDDRRAFREELTWAERCRLYHICHHKIYGEGHCRNDIGSSGSDGGVGP